MSRLRVVHLLASLRPGGAETLAVDLMRGMDRDRFEPLTLLLYPPEGSPLEARLARAEVPVHSLSKRHTGFSARVLATLGPRLKRLRADVVHTHGYPLSYLAPWWPVLGLRGIHTVHTVAPRENPRRLGPPLHRLAFATGVRPVCISEAVRASFEALYPSHPATVIRSGIDLARFGAPTVSPEQWRAAEGLSGEDLVVLCVARLEDVKDPLGVVEAFTRVARTEPRARLVWVGDGTLRGPAGALASDLGIADRVRWLGFREDVPDALHAADVVVLASRYEGLGLAAVEAMAAGRPLVATRVDGLREVVADGETGLLVPPADPAALAQALTALLADPARRRALGEAGRVRARDWDFETTLRRYEALYEDRFEA